MHCTLDRVSVTFIFFQEFYKHNLHSCESQSETLRSISHLFSAFVSDPVGVGAQMYPKASLRQIWT